MFDALLFINKFRYSVLFVLWCKKLIVTLAWSCGLWNEGVAPKRCLWQPYISSNRISQNLIWLKLVTYQHVSKKNYRNFVCCWRKWMWTWYRLSCLHVNTHCLICLGIAGILSSTFTLWRAGGISCYTSWILVSAQQKRGSSELLTSLVEKEDD